MKKSLNVLGTAALLLVGLGSTQYSMAQIGLEGVIVEEYYTSTAADAEPVVIPFVGTVNGPEEGSKTYRIYVDLAEGWQLQQVFGFTDAPVSINTTTGFYNASAAGVQYGDLFTGLFSAGAAPLDSYVSMGIAGFNQNAGPLAGIPKSDDTNGSILADQLQGTINPVNVVDGLVPADGEQLSTQLLGTESLDFVNVNGASSYTAFNTGWFNLNGSRGIQPGNKVLIAQLTTTGELSFNLNLQIFNNDGDGSTTEVYTSVPTSTLPNTFQVPGLIYPQVVTCTADGGTLTTTTTNRSFCVGTGSPSNISVTANGAQGTNQRWALINAAGDVVDTRAANSNFNLDTYPAGNYTIRYLRFENNVDLSGITNISQVGTLEGCFDVASNAIQLFLRAEPQGGTLTPLGPTTLCAGSGNATLQVQLTGAVGENGIYGVADLSQGGLVVATQASTTFNFNTFAPGNYRIVHLRYQQGVNLQGVQFASDLEGCFDLSTPVNVTVTNCAGALLSSSPNPTSGSSVATFNVVETAPTTLEIFDMNGRSVSTLFNQTANAGQEYRIDFDGTMLPNGVYIYRLTTGNEVIIEKMMIAK